MIWFIRGAFSFPFKCLCRGIALLSDKPQWHMGKSDTVDHPHTIRSDSFQCFSKSKTSTITKSPTQQQSLSAYLLQITSAWDRNLNLCMCRTGCQKSELCMQGKSNNVFLSLSSWPFMLYCLNKCAITNLLEESGISENTITCVTRSVGLATRLDI